MHSRDPSFHMPSLFGPCNFIYDTLMVKVKINLEQSMKAQRGRRGIALLFL